MNDKIQKQLITQANKYIEQFKDNFNVQLKYYHENVFPDLIRRATEAIKLAGKEYLDKRSQELIALGKRGWFVDYYMPASMPSTLAKDIDNHNIGKAESTLIEYYRDNIDSIKDNLCIKYPNRATVLEKAFTAHKNNQYELSIPALLIQADGICKELIGVQLYSRNNRIPKTANYVNSLDIISQSYLSPFSENLPISATERERNSNFNELNRHQILHGEISNYGTEINSLKSIYLLNYVAFALKEP